MPTIEELLKSMLTIPADKRSKSDSSGIRLENSVETWRRIGERDSFSELGFKSDSEKEEFLQEWISNNPYSNI